MAIRQLFETGADGQDLNMRTYRSEKSNDGRVGKDENRWRLHADLRRLDRLGHLLN